MELTADAGDMGILKWSEGSVIVQAEKVLTSTPPPRATAWRNPYSQIRSIITTNARNSMPMRKICYSLPLPVIVLLVHDLTMRER